MSQLSRLFEIVYLLLNRKRLTAGELAERFEVSVRTIYRDIDTLSAAGVPVYATQGAGGGIHINDSYVLNKSALTAEEQQQILMALQSLSATDHLRADALLGKLGSLFDKPGADWIEIDFSRWGNRARDRYTMASLKDAIVGQRVLAFTYYSGNGITSDRTVCPIKLVYKSRFWYLQAFDRGREAYRTFKFSRMADIAISDEAFDRDALPPPPALDVVYAPSTAPIIQLALRFRPDAAWRVWDEFDRSLVTWMDDGSLLVRAYMMEDETLMGYLLSFGTAAEVIAPERVRRAFILELQKILARYDENLTHSCQVSDDILTVTKQKEESSMDQPICQSCTMPMGTEDFGTNKDGSANADYCKYCYQDGAFTSDTTMQEMIEICVPHMVGPESGFTEPQARAMLQEMMPELKRWKKA